MGDCIETAAYYNRGISKCTLTTSMIKNLMLQETAGNPLMASFTMFG